MVRGLMKEFAENTFNSPSKPKKLELIIVMKYITRRNKLLESMSIIWSKENRITDSPDEIYLEKTNAALRNFI